MQKSEEEKETRTPKPILLSPTTILIVACIIISGGTNQTNPNKEPTPTNTTPTKSQPNLPMSKFNLLKPILLLFFVFVLLFLLKSNLTTTTTAIPGIRMRPGYKTYDEYLSKQLNKTLNPRLRQVWITRDWDRKVRVFSSFFSQLKEEGLLYNSSRALCIGARVGQEVQALRLVGVSNSIGIDLVPYKPLVIAGDFHKQPFDDESFDLEFSNVFDHALYPDRFVGEVERTLRVGGVCVLHVALMRKGDKYSANDLLNVGSLVGLFRVSEVVRVREVDGFGLDTELVMRKRNRTL